MRTDFFYDSKGYGKIHACRWMPEGEPTAVFQIIHGIADFAERYDDFARYLNTLGYIVVAEDHMGHGQSINGVQGFFHGGWFSAVADSYELLCCTKKEFPQLPYVLFGHSMGSFMARTILCRYPDSGISAVVICGTGWQPRAMMPVAVKAAELFCRQCGEKTPSQTLQNLVFGQYNRKVEHPRSPYDWISRDTNVVDLYISNPLCGFTPSCGLIRDLMKGIQYIEAPANLARMQKNLPMFFVAGGDDPVGSYGKGVLRTVEEFQKAGIQDISKKLYPLGRHEILNEINKKEVYRDIALWLDQKLN